MSKGKLNIINRDRYHSFMKSPVTTYQTNKKVESVRFKMISHDEKYEEQKKKGIQIDITNPEIYVNNKKPIDGIFSPLFGADTTQDTPVYTCDCRKLVGGTNRGRICPDCGTECRSIEADLRSTGYISIKPFHVMTFHGYNAIKSVIKNLDDLITTVKKIDLKGKIVHDGNLTIMDIYEYYDELIYPHTGLEKKYAFTSHIPVISARLRPLMRSGYKINMLEINKLYLSIIKLSRELKAISLIRLNPKIEIQKTLNQIQQDFNRICELIIEQVNGKTGVFRKMLASGRIDCSSRMVISLGSTLKPNEIDIPYVTAMYIYEEEIVNILHRLKDIPISKAISMVMEAQNERDEKFVKIINILLNSKYGIWALINRNPTINETGIFYVRVRNVHDRGDDMTLHLPPDILTPLGADLTKVAC